MPNSQLSPATPQVAQYSHQVRTVLAVVCATLLLAVAGAVFWYQDVRYSLPTPKPRALAAIAVGASIRLPAVIKDTQSGQRALFLHFFNPDCPCSRFNADHVRALRQRFGAQVRFIAVVQILEDQGGAEEGASLAAAKRLFGADMETVADHDGKIAAACGVYSTPQAVILAPGSSRALLFRGNYNSSRYCADPHTEFARLALEALVSGQPLPPESRSAMIAYGCELPANVLAAKKSVSIPKL